MPPPGPLQIIKPHWPCFCWSWLQLSTQWIFSDTQNADADADADGNNDDCVANSSQIIKWWHWKLNVWFKWWIMSMMMKVKVVCLPLLGLTAIAQGGAALVAICPLCFTVQTSATSYNINVLSCFYSVLLYVQPLPFLVYKLRFSFFFRELQPNFTLSCWNNQFAKGKLQKQQAVLQNRGMQSILTSLYPRPASSR